MRKDDILQTLEQHLEKVKDSAQQMYLIKLKQTIDKLKTGNYKDDFEIVIDLQSLGFHDLADALKRSIYL